MNRALSIQSILCKTFQFLDLKSLLQCDLVNKQWLNDARQPSSVYYLNMDDILIAKVSRSGKWYYNMPRDLTRFKNVESVSFSKVLTYSDDTIIGFCHKNFFKLQKIKKIAIRANSMHDHTYSRHIWEKILRNLLLLNMNHLVVIELSTCNVVPAVSLVGSEPWIWSLFCENRKDTDGKVDDQKNSENDGNNVNDKQWQLGGDKKVLSFPELRELTLCNMNLQSFPKMLHEKGLKVLKILGFSYLGKGFWNDLIKYETNISNIEEICFRDSFVHENDRKYLQAKILPAICARIMQKNLIKFESIRDELKNHWISDSNIVPLTFLNGVFWKHLIDKICKNLNENEHILNRNNNKMVKFDCEATVSNQTLRQQRFGVVQLDLKPLNLTQGVLSLKSVIIDHLSYDRYRLFCLPKGFHCHIGEMTCNIHTDKSLVEGDVNDILNVLALKRDDKSQSKQVKNVAIKTPNLRQALNYSHWKNKYRHQQLLIKSEKEKEKEQEQEQEKESDQEKTKKDAKDKNNNDSNKNFSSLFTLGNTTKSEQDDQVRFDFDFGNAGKQKQDWSFSFDDTVTSKDDDRAENKSIMSSGGDNVFSFECGINSKDDKSSTRSMNTSSSVFTFNWNDTRSNESNRNKIKIANSNNNSNIDSISMSTIGFDFVASDTERQAFFQGLIIHGHHRMSLRYISRTLNKIEFEKNCLKYVKIDGVESIVEKPNSVRGISIMKRELISIKNCLDKNNYPKFDILLQWIIGEYNVDECALQLVQLLSLLYNELSIGIENNSNTNDNNSGKRRDIFKLILQIEIKFLGSSCYYADRYFSFDSDWIKTICNGIINIGKHGDNDHADHDCQTQEMISDDQRRIVLPFGFVNITLALQKITVTGSKRRCLMAVEFNV